MIDNRLTMLSMVARHGTVTAAAEAMRYSSSTVSHQLKQLAGELNVELLEQRGRYVQLTPAAKKLLEHVEIIAAEWERALTNLQDYTRGESGTLTLCGFSSAAGILLPRTMQALNQEFPLLHTMAIEAEASECYDLVLAGDADLGVVVVGSDTPARDDARFSHALLINDPLDLVVPRDHPLAEQESISLADAADQTWIVGSPGTTYHQLVMTNCASAGFTPRIGHYANEWETGMALVTGGFGVSVVSRLSSAGALHPIRRIPITGEHAPTRHIAAFTRKGAQDRPALRFALEHLSADSQALVAETNR